jgi:hypothetical protein
LLVVSDRSEPVDIELLEPSTESQPGEPVFVDGFSANQTPEILNPKKKIWDKLQVKLAERIDELMQFLFFLHMVELCCITNT